MGILRNIAIAVFVISFITFVALFGQIPALRRTPVGWLQRLLCIRIPNGFKRIDSTLTRGQITIRSQRLGHYLFKEKNPFVLVLFLTLLTGSAFLFLWNAVHKLPTTLLIPVPPLVVLPYIFTYLCMTSTAQLITRSNHHARMHDYPYDHVIFRPRTVCKTCKLVKPARSKHCSLCGFCIAKCDHHCPWVNTCLGLGNYRYFLALLLSLSMVQFYGAYLSWWILRPYIRINPDNGLFSWGRLDDLGGALVLAVNNGGISIAGVGMLAASTMFLPLGLLAYHCYLIWAGMTTNESQKWSDWKEDMADGYAFQAQRERLQAHIRATKAANSDVPRNAALDLFEDDDHQVKWPVTSNQVLVRTKDGKPPRGQEVLWNPVWSLESVDNIYDLGGWRNLKAVLRGR